MTKSTTAKLIAKLLVLIILIVSVFGDFVEVENNQQINNDFFNELINEFNADKVL